jgi:tRNA nucleotidyltransferase (CCA-adding enzyme)
VRDAILGREPNDWDITTSAMPQDIKRIFHKTIDTGIEHGTVTVLIERVGYEVTTYRIDGEYEDGRHPKSVEFTGNLVEDLKRRDFTINAMAYNDRDGIVDAFDGMGDLKRRVIKCVGNPRDRFNEDALRILRAVRFAAVLDFDIEENTQKAIEELAGQLSKISKERIQAELEKLIMSNHPQKLVIAYETGITRVIFDEIDRLADNNMLDKVINILCKMPQNHYLRWASILCMNDREGTRRILKGLKFDNKTVDTVSRIVGATKRKLPVTRAEVRRDIYEVGEDIYEMYLDFIQIFKSEEKKCDKEYSENIETNTDCTEYVKREYKSIIEDGECISLKGLAVNGSDLINMGVQRGTEVGEGLKMLLYKVLEDPNINEREILINIFMNSQT